MDLYTKYLDNLHFSMTWLKSFPNVTLLCYLNSEYYMMIIWQHNVLYYLIQYLHCNINSFT